MLLHFTYPGKKLQVELTVPKHSEVTSKPPTSHMIQIFLERSASHRSGVDEWQQLYLSMG
jgi:hypothetical protein